MAIYQHTEPLIQKCFELATKKSISNLKNMISPLSQKNNDDNNILFIMQTVNFCFKDKLPLLYKNIT